MAQESPFQKETTMKSAVERELSLKAMAYESELVRLRTADDIEAKSKEKIEQLRAQLDEERTRHAAIERDHQELKIIYQTCKGDLERRLVYQKSQYEVSPTKAGWNDSHTAAPTQNTLLKRELDRLVEEQNEKKAQSSKERESLREEAASHQARMMEFQAENERLTRQVEALRRELAALTTRDEAGRSSREAELRELSQQARTAEAEMREAQRREQEQADAYSQQLAQLQRVSQLKLQEAQETIERQTKLLHVAEAQLLQERRHHEEKVEKLVREAAAKMESLESEKRRATEEASQAILALRQEEERKATDVENLQEQCENLALQHAKTVARAEQLAKHAEGVQADCERRLNEHDRLEADFRALEETHRGLLIETEDLMRSKVEAEDAVADLQRRLIEKQDIEERNKKEIDACREMINEKETAKEEIHRQLQRAVSEAAQLKRVASAKLSSARRKEEKLRMNIRVLIDKLSQVVTERNGLWQALLKVKDDYDVHARRIEPHAASSMQLPISSSRLCPTTLPHFSVGRGVTPYASSRKQAPSSQYPAFWEQTGGHSDAGEGLARQAPLQVTGLEGTYLGGTTGGGGLPGRLPSTTVFPLTADKVGNASCGASPLDGTFSVP
ncbi:hypothetical protein BESB_020940 [Besnoitia besnoiti]|uniref:Uncharacterized protein n=1 Tax=Besnoitia besnoiti TaxID=94643 RepID=A0A2A9M8Y1_BESBE|nr:hypothetical protein BESB_020940 [Besnoitia besnoiti]PFH32153.1 hypothetical protein BESB_020940 [Besnoitia besnoiti]